ncbi:protein EVI2B [Ciconia boyciana]|uniref:protein EVI2B n=1 Tax=Ciconia boyciana TaxID=52775 RepID=UPI003BA12510
MASNQVILFLFYGELWKSLSTAIPQNISMNKRNAYASIRSPTEVKAPLYQLQATLQKSGRALTVTPPPQFPKAYAEPGDGSWIAALIIGIVLVSMITAIITIVLWNCCKRPVLVDSNWAGRSPFADGDTPDVFMDSDQATKRSSVLFMLPWKLKQDTNIQQDPTASEEPPGSTTRNESGQLPPPVADPSVATTPAPSTQASSPAPPSEAASCAHDSCPQPAALPDPPDLPPPPDWLREPREDHSSDLSKHQEFHSETEEQLPPPPESLIQEAHEPLPQLPQPEHPL